MTSAPRPCVVCGRPSPKSRCQQHTLPDTRPSVKRRVSRTVSTRLRRQVLFRDDYTCQMCGLRDLSGRSLEADHLARLADAGEHAVENMQTLCKPCHAEKTRLENTRTCL